MENIEINNNQRINEILKELDNIDKKSIRAIRESNQEILNQYENEAEQLRIELRLLNGN